MTVIALAISGALLAARVAAAAEYWQVSRGEVTVIAASSEAMAVQTAQRVLQMQSAARWLFDWPTDYHPPPVVVFALPTALLRDTFRSRVMPVTTWAAPHGVSGQISVTPQLMLVAFPLAVAQRRELDALQYLYADALLRGTPTATWPECPRIGFAMMFAGAEFGSDNHVYMSASKLTEFFPMEPWRFLGTGTIDPAFQPDVDRRGYACYVLTVMSATSSAESRPDFRAFFEALGAGTPPENAVPAGLGGSLAEFSTRYRRFFDRHQFRPRDFDLHKDLEIVDVGPPQPTPVSPDRMRALLAQLCSRFNDCRRPAASVGDR